MRILSGLGVALWFAVWSMPGHAHTDEYFDKHATPHGGQVRMAGPYHLELVLGNNEVTLYLTDHGDQPVDAAGGSGKAIITTGKRKRYTVVLEYAEGNMLKGVGAFTATSASVVTVIVKLPEQEAQQAQFKPTKKTSTPKKASKPSSSKQHKDQ
jgi:hypothetical protein